MSAFSLLFFDKCNTRTALSYMTADNRTHADNTALSDLADVAGEGGQQRPLPYLTNAGDVGVQQLLEQAAAQPVDEMMTEGGQGQLRAERDHQQQKDQADKLTQDRQRIAA